MKIRAVATLVLVCACAGIAHGQERTTSSRPSKKVLVELYTSQGCNSCPSANEFLGQLARQGYGPDRIVPVAFHVDYFNEPWVDPFSSKVYSRREQSYNAVMKRNDLYFTPMMMVDGRVPMLGSNRPEALRAIKAALAEKPGATLKLTLAGTGPARKLTVEVTPLATEASSRQLMVGVIVTEGPISTRVPSGENAGQTLIEPFVVRSFDFKSTRLETSDSKSFAFPLKLADGSLASRCRVAVFVQDWDNGKVYQSESVPWSAEVRAR